MAVLQTKEFSGSLKCGHCGNSAPMEILHGLRHDAYETVDDDDQFKVGGRYYELLSCAACNEITLRETWLDFQDIPVGHSLLYPTRRLAPKALPEKIDKAFEAANRVKGIDANAFAVLLGRVLELVCLDRSADGKDLADKLKSLSEKGEIPSKLVDVATSLRHFRNVGAHATLGELSPAETSIVDELCRAVLEYVYSAPALVEQAKKSLDKLKSVNGL